MSFAGEVKNEICKTQIKQDCCALSELYGFLIFANTFNKNLIKFTTENENIFKRIMALLDRNFGVEPYVSIGEKTGKIIMKIENEEEIHRVLDGFGYDFKYIVKLSINQNIMEEECCIIAFLRGMFLSVGNVSDPTRAYHLDIGSSHLSLCNETVALMLEIGLNPKISARKGHNIIYFKDSQSIEDFLTLISAPVSALKIMEAKVEKELINNINRKVNCENGNIGKTVDAATKQIVLLREVINSKGIEIFPESLHKTINLRMDNPQASIAELAEMEGLTKSGMSHRLRKITTLAQNIKEKL